VLLDIKNVCLVPNTPKGIFKISLCLTLMVFVLTMTPTSTFLQITKQAAAAPLTKVSVTPDSNVKNERATYNFFLTTGTTGTIKTIEITFPSSFDLADIRFIERSGIGTGTLSVVGSTIKYTVTSAVSVAAGSNIKLVIGRIIATGEGSHTVSIKTLTSGGGTIDGPTTSSSFVIKAISSADILDNTITSSDIADNTITGNEISPGFMVRKTVSDDDAGHAVGWDPNGVKNQLRISEPNAKADSLVFIAIFNNFPSACTGNSSIDPSPAIFVTCSTAIGDHAQLNYILFNLPNQVVTSSLPVSESTISSPFDSIGPNE